jgi:hypothetical protein
LQIVPSGNAGLEHTPLPLSHTPTSWHESLAVQTTGFDPAQIPVWHESVCVQAFPSLHAVPFGAFGFEHTPVTVLQTPTAWHASLAVQTTGIDPAQKPDWHESVWVQAFPSLQSVPSGAAGFEHSPVPVLQTPATWHASLAVQFTGFVPAQTPDSHESICVQAFPSLHVVPFGRLTFEHAPVPVSHASVVQGFVSLQLIGFEPKQTPDWQVSVCVQAFPSAHSEPFGLIGLEQTPVPVSQSPTSWH